MPKEFFMTNARLDKDGKHIPGQLVEVDTGTDDVVYLTPATTDKDGKTVLGRAVQARHVEPNEDDVEYLEPVSYFEEARRQTTVRNSMSEDIDALSADVLRLMAAVERSPVGSVERGRAEADLVHAEGQLRTALRTALTELEAERPQATAARVQEIDTALATVRRALEALEDDKPGLAKNSNAGKTAAQFFAQQGKKAVVVRGMFGSAVMVG